MSRRRPVLVAMSLALALPLSLSAMGAAGAAPPAPEPPPTGSDPGLPIENGSDLTRPGGAEDRATGLPFGGSAGKVSPALMESDGIVTAFVELDATSGVETADAGGDAADVEAAAEQVQELAEEVVPETTNRRAAGLAPRTLTVTTNLVAGMVVSGDAARVRALAGEDAVAAVHLIVPKKPTNKGADVFTRAVEAWQATGLTGDGVTIGVVDTGVDYTHADFGGPGTDEAYALAYGEDGTGPVPDGVYDEDKYLGGYDFAGPTYNADDQPVPMPDANPIDAPDTGPNGGHGTHVAGSAAGYGVLADGTTFDGDYAELTDISDWKIGPGTAPHAGVYALKVFGDDGGSTGLVIQALEWAADPNGDFDYNDRLDILNLSLGSDTSPADDPENLFIDQLSALGVLSVIASGNASDVTDIGGSPGNSRSALTVANSVADTQTYDAIEVVEAPDASLVGNHAAQNSVNYTGGEDVTAPVVHLGDTVDGCTSLDEYAAEIEGNIVWLWWDDNDSTRACGSAVRWNNAEDAGAVGVLIGTELPVFPAGIAGNTGIPGAQLTASATDALLPAIEAGGVVVHLGPSLANAAFVTEPDLGDTLSSGSSRGVHGSLGIVKPDVAAPGTLISSAASGTGDAAATKSGTSMATPHVAGIAALVAEAQPGWTPAQVKASVMNTATHDVYSELGQTGPVYGPERVGSGRVDALDAAQNEVIAYATDDADLVTVAFGVVGVGEDTLVERRTVTVRNTSGTSKRYTTSFAGATTAGGATITVSPASITVPAGKSRLVTVTLTADPDTLAKDLDPTSEPTYDLGIPVPRDYLAAVSGRLVLTPTSGSNASELRVPVHAAPRLVSDLSAEPVTFGADEHEAPLTLTGRGVASGGWYSLVAPFALMASSPQLEDDPGTGTSESSIAAADLRYVGFASTAPQLEAAGAPAEAGSGTLGIGLATEGEWATLGTNVIPIIDTDIDGDGIWDLETYIWKYGPELDFTTVETYELTYTEADGYELGDALEVSPVNGLWADVDTTVFDNNVVVAPMTLDAVGIAEGDIPTFLVSTYSPYAPDDSGIVDEAEPFTADPFDPPYWFDGGEGSEDSLFFLGQPGEAFSVHRSPEATQTELLLLHTHNDTGERAEVVDVTVSEPEPELDASQIGVLMPGSVKAGKSATVAVVVRSEGATPTGTIKVSEDGEVIASATVHAYRRTGFAAVRLPRDLAVGTHHLTITYSGNDEVAPSSVERDLKVVKKKR